MTLGKVACSFSYFNIYLPQFLHFQNGNNNSTFLAVLPLILNESMYVSADGTNYGSYFPGLLDSQESIRIVMAIWDDNRDWNLESPQI